MNHHGRQTTLISKRIPRESVKTCTKLDPKTLLNEEESTIDLSEILPGKSPFPLSTKDHKSLLNADTKGAKQKEQSATPNFFTGSLLRLILLDVPLLLIFSLLVSTYMLEHITKVYFKPMIDLFDITPEREKQEETYYRRSCSGNVVSATTPSELMTHPNMTLSEIRRMSQTHGATMYANMISEDTARQLRDFILKENSKNKDIVNVLNMTNRWSFEIQIDHHPIVAKAAREILSNQHFVRSIEAIIGPNPAVTEFTAITAAHGAPMQPFHQDSSPGSNNYARTMIPQYSFFIPLQNTTFEMGPTAICPGTHKCPEFPQEECETQGFAMSGPDNNWPLGHGALFSQQLGHRAEAHTDPNSPERVVFYFVFAPRPRTGPFELETRSFPIDGTYGLHWKQHGFTLRDYQNPEKYMLPQPWRLLRVLGLYKQPGRQWGWDWITMVLFSLANEQDEYVDEALEEYDTFRICPKYGSEEDWLWVKCYDYLLKTCLKAIQWIYASMMVVYVICSGRTILRRASSSGRASKRAGCVAAKLLVMHLIVLAPAWLALDRISQSKWARHIKSKRTFQFPKLPNTPNGGVSPTLKDVLMLEDYRSDYLGEIDGFIDVTHPGNIFWRKLVVDHFPGYDQLPRTLQAYTCSKMLESLQKDGRRVLAKNSHNNWAVVFGKQTTSNKSTESLIRKMEEQFLKQLALFEEKRETLTKEKIMEVEKILREYEQLIQAKKKHLREAKKHGQAKHHARMMRFCHKDLMQEADPYIGYALVQLDYLLSETKFGYWRETSLHRKVMPSYLRRLQDRVMKYPKKRKVEPSSYLVPFRPSMRPAMFERIKLSRPTSYRDIS